MSVGPALGRIQALALDVDGVLTDGSFLWGPGGEESKRFHFRDVMGLSRSIRAGLKVVLISGEDTPLLDRFAAKTGIPRIFRGCRDKAAALKDYSAETGVPLQAICFIGDDINDVEAMALAGASATPADGHPLAKAAAGMILQTAGGHGAVREWTDLWLADRAETPGELK